MGQIHDSSARGRWDAKQRGEYGWRYMKQTQTQTQRARVKRTQPRSAPPHPVTGTVRRLLCAAIISEMTGTGAAQRSVIGAAPQHRPESANHMRDLPNETETFSR